ncbi:response regulator [Fredinandcohnia sp. 179-A 10B2 NHS]|uniref:response regulator n=1 Tax=Fredinandcohnia sp. 179-A 10B2 NHS TaxID=3235176 RepID=UPI00399FFA2F
MKIKTKLLLSLSTLPLLLLILIGIGIVQITHLTKASTSVKDNHKISTLSEQIYRDVKDEGIILRNLVIFRNEDSIEAELAKLRLETEAIQQNLNSLESESISIEQKQLVAELRALNDRFNKYKDAVVTLVSNGKVSEAQQLMSENSISLHEEFSKVSKQLTNSFETSMESSLEKMLSNSQRELINSLVVLVIGISGIGILLFITVWSISKQLTSMAGIMSDIANGSVELNTKVEVKSKDEIFDVASSFNKMTRTLANQIEKDQQLTWAKTHIAEITTSLSGTPDLESLAQTFLSKTVPLVESSHAVFYSRDINGKAEEPTFKLLASYALKERKQISNIVRTGEGLVGQAILEKSPILLTDVPTDYIQISSGLGKATPLNIYVIPILFEGDVIAVLEMASFKKYSDIQQSFLEELTANLGIIYENLMGRIRLATLLEESQTLMEEIQAQSEELQVQQEELRATNEELEQQTQSLRYSEERLQAQQEELEQTNAELEEKAKSLEEQNRRFEQKNREVENARNDLEEKAYQLSLASKYKSEFLANMSHELRTPLNSLLILSKLLADNKEGNLTDKQKEYSNTIYSSGNDLLSLINDILDLAKIESGKMDLDIRKVQISTLVDFARSTFEPIANEKGLELSILQEEGLPKWIISDEIRIQQVLRNLLSNACKFTHKGTVTLEISSAPTSTSKNSFLFTVSDSGIGIPKDKIAQIFEAFQQADGTTSRKYGGTGLGLSISRENANLLGGEINVESTEGKGSIFTFKVSDFIIDQLSEYSALDEAAASIDEPVLSNSDTLGPQQEKADLPGKNSHIKRILIVDDDAKQRTSLMELIGDLDVIIKAVATGQEALEELKVNKFDCVILDLSLEDTTGFRLLEKMKEQETNEVRKIIVYSGRIISQQEETQLLKYVDTIIVKNEHSPQRLKDELRLFFEGYNVTSELLHVGKVEQMDDLKNKRILLVDDDVRNVYALSNILELYGMDVTFAENGIEGLDILNRNNNYDLVLMDIMMPEMDGYEAIRKIRETPKLMDLPIIALTAKAMKEDREKCLTVGASDYIVKPVDPDKLISLIKVWLYQERN